MSAATSVARIGMVPRVNPVVFAPDHPMIDQFGRPTTWDDEGCNEIVGWEPDYLMLFPAFGYYATEHLIAEGRDPRRIVIVAKHAFDIFGPEIDITKIDRPLNRHYIATRQAEGAKGSTIRRELALIQACANHNVTEGRIKGPIKLLKPKAGTPRLRWLTRVEHRALMALDMEPRIRLFLLLAFGTGARSFAMEECEWSQVNFETRLIDYKKPGAIYRNKKRAIVPISDALLPELQRAYQERAPGDPYVIGRGGCTYRKVKAVMRRIGIDEEGVARHVARHTFASWLLQAGVPIAYVAQLLGDKVSMVESVYGHLIPDNTRGAVNLALLAA